MAARKKVTKKASSEASKSASIRSRRKGKRAAESKKKRTVARSAKTSQVKVKSKTKSSRAGASKSAAKTKARAKSAATANKEKRAAARTGEKAGNASVKIGGVGNAGGDGKVGLAVATPELNLAPAKIETKSGVLETVRLDEAKGAKLAPKRNETAAAPALAGTTVKTGTTETAPVPAAPASALAPVGAAKTVKASAPAKTLDREPPGGEQKTMKNSSNKHGFKLNEFVVYPAHGVGQIVAMEEQEVAGFRLELFVINFVKDKMTLRVPTSKVVGVGMRKLSEPDAARRSLEILTGRARIKRTMWSRRAQEYEAKINSGDINAIAEVVRDLYRSEAQPEQSYSERQLYEAALDRMMREIAAVQKLSENETLKVIEAQLKKNLKRGVKPETPEGEEASIEEAA